MRRFNDLADFSREEIKDLIALATRLDAKPEPRALEGKVLSLLFLSPSLRTLVVVPSRDDPARRRLVRDLARHVDPRPRVALRHRHGRHRSRARPRSDSRDRVVRRRDRRARIRRAARPRARPRRHRLQEPHELDRQAVDQHGVGDRSSVPEPRRLENAWTISSVPENGKFVLSWAYHPRALPLAVPAATLHMAAKRGMNVTVLRPPGFELPPAIMDKARRAAAEVRRQRQRDGGPARSADRRAHHLRQGVVVDAALRRQARRSGAARGARALVRRRAVVRRRAARRQAHALLARAPRRRGHRSDSRRPAQRRDSRKRATACTRRWPCCTG